MSISTLETPTPLPSSARREQLGIYLAEVEHLRKLAAAASLVLKRHLAEPCTEIAPLRLVLDDIEEGLQALQDKRAVVMPTIGHSGDNTDAIYDAAYNALEHIFAIEALLGAIRPRLDQQPDGHLITLADLCHEQLPKLRFALYGEDMGP